MDNINNSKESNEDNNTHPELKCPFTLDYFEDLIQLPCCGQAISREPICVYMNNGKDICPLCRDDISSFAPRDCAPLRNLASLVEKAKNGSSESSNTMPDPIENSIHLFNENQELLGSLTMLVSDNNISQKMICRLNIDTSTLDKTLLIAVIDKSGSMSNEMHQVRYSLENILNITYDNPNRNTTLVLYNHQATSVNIDKSRPKVEYERNIRSY